MPEMNALHSVTRSDAILSLSLFLSDIFEYKYLLIHSKSPLCHQVFAIWRQDYASLADESTYLNILALNNIIKCFIEIVWLPGHSFGISWIRDQCVFFSGSWFTQRYHIPAAFCDI